MSAVVATVKLHLNQRSTTFLTPLYIAGVAAVVSILISLLFWRSGSLPGTPDWVQGSRSNGAIAWALAGFMIPFGVTSVAVSFPFALALGATRRSFVTGTLLWYALTSAYIAALFALLLGVELATGHWFAGFYIYDVYVLGAGNIGRLLAIVFLGVLTSLTVGGVFAASWVRFGSRGPQVIGAGLVVAAVVGLIVVLPALPSIAAAFQLWWLAVGALGTAVLASTSTWLLLRPAVVR